jgi:hypothetical protein
MSFSSVHGDFKGSGTVSNMDTAYLAIAQFGLWFNSVA